MKKNDPNRYKLLNNMYELEKETVKETIKEKVKEKTTMTYMNKGGYLVTRDITNRK